VESTVAVIWGGESGFRYTHCREEAGSRKLLARL
jgi:hypothetical protein